MTSDTPPHCVLWFIPLTLVSLRTPPSQPVVSQFPWATALGSVKFWSDFFLLWELICETQFNSVVQSCPTLCDPMDCRTPGLPVHHQLLEFIQTYVNWVCDAIQLSHPLSSPSPPVLNLSQHQDLFTWVSFLHQVAKVLEFQLQHQSFQWTPGSDLL